MDQARDGGVNIFCSCSTSSSRKNGRPSYLRMRSGIKKPVSCRSILPSCPCALPSMRITCFAAMCQFYEILRAQRPEVGIVQIADRFIPERLRVQRICHNSLRTPPIR